MRATAGQRVAPCPSRVASGLTRAAPSVTYGVEPRDDSGSMTIATADSGRAAERRDATTGPTFGATGAFTVETGIATGGAGVRFPGAWGMATPAPAGAVTVTAGKTTADSAAGGALTLKAGIGEGNSGSGRVAPCPSRVASGLTRAAP